ncbi:TonB-dependent receptor domain-containing protein, partial [Leptospira sp. SA-E8]|uniref:TonB-dependent receptor domain-containing protein n=1 Tax=Leptospira sp. SA-E8 TaxID=3422259 RepID=UPI003EB830D9
QRTTDSVFVGLNGNAGSHGWQLNLRQEDNSQYGDATTGFVGYGYKLTSQLQAHASYGTSFKAPTFNQLYYPSGGNSDLHAEEGRNREYGLSYTPDMQEYKVVYFDNRVHNLIAGWPAENINKARLQGWTLSYGSRFDALALHAALDLL